MNYLDLHCDTASKLYYDSLKLEKNKLSVDIFKMKKGGAIGQFFAFFIDSNDVQDKFLEFERMHEYFIQELSVNQSTIKLVTNVAELERANTEGKIGAFLSIEEGDVLEGDINKIKKVYEKGVRVVTITWNYKNKLGYPNYNFLYRNDGLTDLGKEMVVEMERVGIIPDASHLSDKGFYDLIDICRKPFIVTHSNSRNQTHHSRNLTDDMIVALANKGGVMGINFCSNFLGISKVSKIDDIVRHINHIRKIGGIDVISLGSDFDGIDNDVEIKDPGEMNKLVDALSRDGYHYYEIEKIFYKNSIRLLKESL